MHCLDSLQTRRDTQLSTLNQSRRWGGYRVFGLSLLAQEDALTITLTITSAKVFGGVIAVIVTTIIAIKKRLK